MGRHRDAVAGTASGQRSDLKPARTSAAKSAGCSHAAKWPPLSSLLKWISLGNARSAQRRARQSSDVLHLVQVGRIALGLHVVAMDEPKRRRVDAIAQSAAVLRPVRKYMAEMAVAVRRAHLGARHSVRRVADFVDVGRVDARVKLGQPEPESNFSDEANSGSPETTST